MEVLRFVFSSFWRWLGFFLLLWIVSWIPTDIVRALRGEPRRVFNINTGAKKKEEKQ